jgi:hypothetical protein
MIYMNTFLKTPLFSIIIFFLFFSSCTTSENQNRKKVTAAMTSSFENAPTDTARIRWLEHLVWPAWTSANMAGAKIESIDDKTAGMWLRWVIPLPKLIRLEGRLTLPSTGISLRLRSGATALEQSASDELARFITEKTGVKQLNGSFRILIGVCDDQGKIDSVSVPGAEMLRGLKNDDQAYIIAPLATAGIAVAALTERGVYHGVKTLQQLLEPGMYAGKIRLPILTVLDWPDLAERGQWTTEKKAIGDILYMAKYKMNLLEVRSPAGFDKIGRGTLEVDTIGMQEAQRHAVNWIPFIAHLANQGYRTDIYKLYPELQGKGPHARNARNTGIVVPCASQPQLTKVLAEWLLSAARQGATEVNIFLSELEGMQCECDKCKGKSQFALEARACVQAWKIARKEFPKLSLRILLSQGSYDTNDQVLASVPEKEVGISYYSGSSMGKIPGYAQSTYTASQYPMIYPLMAEFAKQGRWLGCYPQITASWAIVSPWSCPQFIRFRMTEFVDKGLVSVSAYIPPDKLFFDFNFTALAEWSWNSHGRTEHEFAAAWATRRRLADPEKVADWAVMLGPVSWNVYGSDVLYKYFTGSAASIIKKHQKPILGKGMFLCFPALHDMDNDLTVCKKALKLAEKLADKAIIAETLTIEGYLKMVKSIYLIADLVAENKVPDKSQTLSIQAAFNELQDAEQQTIDALNVWIDTVAPDYEINETSNAAVVIHQTVSDIAVSLEPLGIKTKP